VILVGGTGNPIFMIDSDSDDDWNDTVKLFDTEQEAHEAGSQNPFGKTYGYEVIEWGWS